METALEILGGIAKLIGSLVLIVIVLMAIDALFRSIPNWFPGWRVKRQQKAFDRGRDYAVSLMDGKHDDDILNMFPSMEGRIDMKYRLRYINARLEESNYFDKGSARHFDRGVESIVRPLINEHLSDEESPEWY